VTRLAALIALAAAVAAPAFGASAASGSDVFSQHRGFVLGSHAVAGARGDVEATSNWAGYAVTAADPSAPTAFTGVSGTWKVPALRCGESDDDSHAAFWVGLGGYVQGTQALEQIGTWADCNLQGPPSYFAWYELLPGPALSFALAIEPGDTLKATVAVDTQQHVTLTLRNLTRHTVASVRQRFQMVDLSSAEWVAEAPTYCDLTSFTCGVAQLANFGSVAMSNLQATANGKSGSVTSPLWTSTPLEIHPTSGNTVGTCTPTNLAGNGASFRVSWDAAAQAGC
jgi:hypothetical protein